MLSPGFYVGFVARVLRAPRAGAGAATVEKVRCVEIEWVDCVIYSLLVEEKQHENFCYWEEEARLFLVMVLVAVLL